MTRTIITLAVALVACLTTNSALAQTNSKWTLYSSFSNITEIAPAGGTAFALSDGGLFSYNSETGETAVYDKTNSLSDANIAHIAWSKSAKQLVIAYESSNIDLLTVNGNVTNVPDIYMKSTTLNKSINHIYIDGPYAYLSLGLGVVKLDVKRGIIVDTYQLGFNIDYTYTKDGYIYAASSTNGLYRGKQTDNLLDTNHWQRIGDYTPLMEDRLNVEDTQAKLWWTRTESDKLACYTIDANGNRVYKTEGVSPEGPASNHFYRLYFKNGLMYAVGGYYSRTLDGGYPGEVHVWDGNKWTEFERPSEATTGHKNVDYISMDFDPLKPGHVMVAAKSGLYEYQDGKFVKCYNMDNSPLTSCVNSKNYIIVSDIKYDANGTLWLFNASVDNSLFTLSPSGEWKAQAVSANIKASGNKFLENIVMTNNGTRMWFSKREWKKSRVYVYDIANNQFGAFGPSFVNEDGAVVEPNDLFDLALDRDGNIWMSTTSGPLYFAPDDFVSSNNLIIQHKVPRNDGTNLADYLLANTTTTCMAVDGSNRKWFGTRNGVFLISEDCNTQLQHFTTDNSPLMSNEIIDIGVDPNSNMVYFATTTGLCSYASDATQPTDKMTKDNVYAYPNPVRPDYTGTITIVGLSYKADVKIVTSNGTLVNQGRSTGGSYHWDGRDLKGKRVASGIYMVEAANEDGSKGTVCKIAVVN
ncbi:Por secretion system protein [uncultured Prevotella sp.]|uniref:type IX secretion system anionic LPS delivery protein PorZ n=1 Tax=uncultured Prevotella sp. TaxID=159272 RepID=UPI002619EABC|nr:Por secretion system protein [uncultured Prevotella sp.]